MSGPAQTDDAAVDNAAAKTKVLSRDPKIVERDELLASMDAKIEAQRKTDDENFLRGSNVDPQAFLLHQRMQAEARTEAQALETATPPETNEEPADLEDGAAEVEAFVPPAPAKQAVKPAERVSTKGEDPLGDFIVRVNGKPMFKTMVYGKEKLIPLEAARAELQKINAGNAKLEEAAALRKNLEARAAALQTNEAQFLARSRSTAQAPAEDTDLDAQAAGLVRSLVTEPEAQAAAKLATVLRSLRQAPAAPVDVDAITQRAAEVAKQTLVEHETTKAFKSGFEKFTSDYHEIATDPELFALADKRTETIAAEHPEWSPSEVMFEAGRQTREWMARFGMKVPAAPPQATGPSNRQQRKEGLRPMPTPRTARPSQAQETTGNAPSDALAEIRKSRGQAY